MTLTNYFMFCIVVIISGERPNKLVLASGMFVLNILNIQFNLLLI